MTSSFVRSLRPLPVRVLLASCGLALAAGAQAQISVRPLVGGGVTFGGDRLVDVVFFNEEGVALNDARIKAGQFLQMYGGASVQLAPQWSVQGTVGYHWHTAEGENGRAKLSRYPIELIGQYHLDPNWRIGLGARHVRRTRLDGSSTLSDPPVNFSLTAPPSTGAILEGEYVIEQRLGVKLRYVSEKYDLQGFDGPRKASHVGLMLNLYLGDVD